MVDKLLDMTVFARIAENGSLSAAARTLNLSLPVISRRLSQLEYRLGVRLINRTTRRLTLTDDGVAFHARCAQILADVDEAETEASKGRDTATGLLRVTSSVAFSRRTLAPLLREFAERHPDLKIELYATDKVINIVDAGFDLAVRFGTLDDSSLISRRLAANVRVICAAPAYLDKHGRPVSLNDLLDHDCIVFGDPPLDHWTFVDGQEVRVKGCLKTNDGELAHQWALDGVGLVMKSIWDVGDDVQAGRLELVLPEFKLPAAPIHAIYPHSKLAAAKVRLCVAFLRERVHAMVPGASLRLRS
jgi:DNA-binding transcriptional LysR family regulator